MNIQDVADFLDLVKNPDKYNSLLQGLVDEQKRLTEVAETVVKISAFDKEKKKFESDKAKMDKQIEKALVEIEETKKMDMEKATRAETTNQSIKEENETLNKQLKEKLAYCEQLDAELKKREKELLRQETNLDVTIKSTEEVRKQLEDKLAAIRSLGV